MENKEPHRKLIVTLSIIIPIAVAFLFKVHLKGFDFSFLPPIYASINGVTAVLLVTAVVLIKNKKRVWHERIMRLCIVLSAIFLVMYILYHMTSEPATYGGHGPIRYLYFIVLISHISLSIVIIPLVLFTFSRAISGNFERHKALARFTFPIWLYVAITGVVVYVMKSLYYNPCFYFDFGKWSMGAVCHVPGYTREQCE
jgi:putative membrane protein